MSLNFLATRFQCTWPWSTLVMLCDGRVVCGCADPYGHRVLGDARAASIHDVWTGPVVSQLRADLNTGGSKFCGDCPQYRQRGKFDVAIANLRAMADEKRKAGRDLPFLNWRYILFKWNDSDAEMARAREMASEIGVDRLCWELTDHPESAYSRRFVPGSPELESIRHEIWDDNNLGNAIPGATPRAHIDVRTLLPGIPLIAKAGRPLAVRTRVRNLSTRAFPAQATYGRRLVRLGAQLCSADGTMIDRDFARAWLPDALGPGAHADIAIEIPAPAEPGRYALKFDLVSEGIDWFERAGSPTTTRAFWVR